MRSIVLTSPFALAIEETDRPQVGPGEALVRIRKVGICGSDIHLYRHGRIGDIVLDGPFVIGHECMGCVEEVGEGVDRALIGARVAVDPAIPCGRCEWCLRGLYNVCPTLPFVGLPDQPGAFQECIAHPARLVEPLSDAMSDEAAVVLEPLAIAMHAVNLSKVRPGQQVAILGTGVMGTCVLAVLGLHRGLHVVCADLRADRLQRAEAMGASRTVLVEEGEPDAGPAGRLREALGGPGADIVFECAGAPQTIWNAGEIAAPCGHLMQVGSGENDRLTFSSGTSRRKGLTIRVVRRSLHTLRPCIDLCEKGFLDPGRLVTHTFAARDAARAFEAVDRAEEGLLKAIVDMTEW
jgi:L-iditol 2-dehydrogenase